MSTKRISGESPHYENTLALESRIKKLDPYMSKHLCGIFDIRTSGKTTVVTYIPDVLVRPGQPGKSLHEHYSRFQATRQPAVVLKSIPERACLSKEDANKEM